MASYYWGKLTQLLPGQVGGPGILGLRRPCPWRLPERQERDSHVGTQPLAPSPARSPDVGPLRNLPTSNGPQNWALNSVLRSDFEKDALREKM